MSGHYKYTILALDSSVQTAVTLIAKYGGTTYTFLALGAAAIAALLIPKAVKEKKAAISAELEGLEEKRSQKLRDLVSDYRAESEYLRHKVNDLEGKLDEIDSLVDELESENLNLKAKNELLTAQNVALEARVCELTQQVPHE